MTPDGLPYPAVAGARVTAGAGEPVRTLAARLHVGPCLVACDSAAFGLAGALTDVPAATGVPALALIVVAYDVGGLYRPRLTLSLLDDLPSLAARALAVAALVGVSPLAGSEPAARRLLSAAVFGIAVLLVTRGLSYTAIREARRSGLVAHRTLVVGDGEVGRKLAAEMRRHPEHGLRVAGFLGPASARPPDGVPLLGAPAELARVVRDRSIAVVVLAFTSRPSEDVVSCIRACDNLRCDVFWMPQPLELSTRHPHVDLLWGYPLMRRRREVFGPAGRAVKRCLDVVVAAAVLLLAVPVMAACAAAIRLQDQGPVLFRQRRLGAGLRSFVLVKFRTLPAADAAPGRLGRFLRRYSLDELPQLVNVLRGEMSLVGPRPERPELVDSFSRRYAGYRDRHRVRTGMTGWSQIHGLRGDGSVEDRGRFDNQYIENWSLWEDVKILLRTSTALLRHQGR
jgi:exopolysaccharide biosynthesis polyprenyl glycosylphosphotransferase